MAIEKPHSVRGCLNRLQARLDLPWERDRRDTLFLMGASALSVLPHAAQLPWWVIAMFCALFVWRLALLLSGRRLPGRLLLWLGVFACAAAVMAAYRTLLGREAGVAMLVLFLGLKLLEMRAHRDLFIVIFLCLFLLLTAFLQSQGIVVAVASLFACFMLVSAMLTMHYGEREPPLLATFKTTGLIFAQAIPLAALLFLLFPRIEGPLWSMPGDRRVATSGLSETMRPGDITQLGLSQEIVFRVQFENREPMLAQMYWRGPVLSRFDGRQWSPRHQSPGAKVQLALQEAAQTRLGYTVTLEPTRQRWLFALEAPAALGPTVAPDIRLTPDLQLLANRPVTERRRDRFESVSSFRLGLAETALGLRDFVQLPPGFNPRTLQLAADWQAVEQDPARLVERALRMFREQAFRYTLDPPLLGKHSVDEFLFDTRAGFCEHYASAFAVLMRALDIPARVVTGYHGAERNPLDGYWTVRQSDAHAWAEVWIAGRGWTRIDPTAAIAPDRIERGARALAQSGLLQMPGLAGLDLAIPLLRELRLNLDALTNAWNQWVLGYDQRLQLRLLERLGVRAAGWQSLVAMLAGGLLMLMLLLAVATLRTAAAADALTRCHAAFCARLERVGVMRQSHETALQLLGRAACRLDARSLEQAREIVDAYNRLRYGPQSACGQAHVRHLRTLIRSFKP
jgi:transglutaminase-like putative cysteine protease